MRSPRLTTALQAIGANLRKRRVSAGLSQERLAEKADLEVRTVQDVEAARTNLSVATLIALADAVGAVPEALFRPARFKTMRPGRPAVSARTNSPRSRS